MVLSGLSAARVWHLVDAKNKHLGRIAQRIAIALTGKYKPTHNPAVDNGDYVVVVNARNLDMSAQKSTAKTYRWHSGYQSGVTKLTYKEFSELHPAAPIRKAVYGMLPKNNLRKEFMRRLKIFPDAEHPYEQNILR
ncbi:50S ribosomal protein L13 [Cladochytrium replicatum]|nr:50S ribosomal protein L13 [Cladochytrium replicatum]